MNQQQQAAEAVLHARDLAATIGGTWNVYDVDGLAIVRSDQAAVPLRSCLIATIPGRPLCHNGQCPG